MEQAANKTGIIRQLQQEILAMQGYKSVSGHQRLPAVPGPIEKAFPNNAFPTGAIHEFLSPAQEHAAATSGFMTGLLGKFMRHNGACLWISTRRMAFPPALQLFGIPPERIIFVDLARERDALWAIEEALKCNALSAVVGELKELSFTESRRLQLAVESSRVTGFIHRYQPRKENPVACAARWKITAIASKLEDGMPGVGHPRWQVQLLKVRNGQPGSWQIEWHGGDFRYIPAAQPAVARKPLVRKTG